MKHKTTQNVVYYTDNKFCVVPYSLVFLAGHKLGGFGPTRYNIYFDGYNFGEFFFLHQKSIVSLFLIAQK